MTTPFTSFAFEAAGSGVNTNITLPDRLAYIKNVKDFGARGDGVTDDWAAIMAAFNWTTSTTKGTIFFPPGTYLVSQPINIGPVDNIIVALVGVYGASTINGNFADYVIKKANATAANPSYVENLTVINTNASGGGIRLGGCVTGAVRNCTVTANRGINTSQSDNGFAGATSLESVIENCVLSPGSNTSGSIGLMVVSDGPVLNCRVVGFQVGMVTWGQEGAQYVAGCYFEGNQTAILPGSDPTLTSIGNSGMTISGCEFKNNGTALALTNSNAETRCVGLRIEASESVTVFGARPQYGIQIGDNTTGYGFFAGINITGQYDQFGFSIGEVCDHATFLGVQVSNTSSHGGLPWHLSTSVANMEFKGCNVAPVFTMAGLPTLNSPATGTWSSGTATITCAFLNLSPYIAPGIVLDINIQGMTPSGYNGSFSGAIATGVSTLTFTLANPGGSGTGGTIIVNPSDTNGTFPANEGDCYNVSDSNTATWAANPARGGSTHAKIRYNNTFDWAVVGI